MIGTERLILRPWCEADVDPFLAMSRDPAVMRYIGPSLTMDQVVAAMARMQAYQAQFGYCFWAIERTQDGVFLGFCGLKPGIIGPLKSEIEIGWRMAHHAWGQGYAREAAQASIDWAWRQLDVPSIAAITVPANTRSWHLMQRLGMTRVPDGDFDHPALADGDPLRRHFLYRIARPNGA